MPGRKEQPKRLYPEQPPKRLPEAELYQALKKDGAFRRQASVLRGLLHHPRRLIQGAPRRLLPARARRELGYRLTAMVTSFALLLSLLGGLGPMELFGAGNWALATGEGNINGNADYEWLKSGGSGTEADPFLIGSADQLAALAELVLKLGDADFKITVDGRQYAVAEGTLDLTALVAAADTALTVPAPTPESEAVPTPTTVPEPTPTAAPEATATPVPEPTPTATPEATATPVPEPTPTAAPEATATPAPEATAAPTPEPTPTPEETPVPVQSPALGSGGASGGTAAALAILSLPLAVQAAAAPEPETAPTPDLSSNPTPIPEGTPEAEATPTPVPDTTPTPTPEATSTPAPEAAQSPAPEPESAADTGAPSPAPSTRAGNTLYLPAGLKGCYIKLDADLRLNGYMGSDSSGVSNFVTWVPIGILADAGDLAGTSNRPFEGVFDGGGHTVTDFHYPSEKALHGGSTASPGGYGLFGYIGAEGVVRNLNIHAEYTPEATAELPSPAAQPLIWDLGPVGIYESLTTTPKSPPVSAYAVGVLAAASAGVVEDCSVYGALLRYTPEGTADKTVGGLVGVLAGKGNTASLTGCTFLGSIQGGAGSEALQRVGGLAGAVNTAATVKDCAAGVSLELHNQREKKDSKNQDNGVPDLTLDAGIGGLVGFAADALTLSGCFSAGTVTAANDAGGLAGRVKGKITALDAFSTAALGSNAAPTSTGTLYATQSAEGIGGLFGSTTGGTGTLTNVYFAGALLEPQLASVSGNNQTAWTVKNLAVDAEQAPHSAFKANTKDAVTPEWDMANFTAAPAAWVSMEAGFLPRLAWTNTATGNPAGDARKAALSSAAAWRYEFGADSAVKGLDGFYGYYRLKGDAAPDQLAGGASAPALTRTADYTCSDGTVIGGLYTGTYAVDGFDLPYVHKGFLAPNQTEGRANEIGAASFTRFLDSVNLAGGGYLGGLYQFADGAVDVSAAPVANYKGGKPFCGVLQGGVNSAVSGVTFPAAQSVGLFNTAYQAVFQDVTLKNVELAGLVSGSDGYFGTLAGAVYGVTAKKITVDGFSYQYTGTANGGGHDTKHTGIGVLFGNAYAGPFQVEDCALSGVDVSVSTSGSEMSLAVGGILGNVRMTGALYFKNCTVDASIKFAFTGKTNPTPDYNKSPTVGGIVGYDNTGGTLRLSGCHVMGRFQAGNTGGLIGRSRYYNLQGCTFTGEISSAPGLGAATTSGSNAGGLVAYPEHSGGGGLIDGCAVFGSISAMRDAGGLIGTLNGNSATAITNCSVSAVVRSTAATGGAAGGFIGNNQRDNTTYQNSYFTGQVEGAQAGGILGKVTKMPASSPFTNVLYDKTLTQATLTTVGGVADAAYQCGVTPDSEKWAEFADVKDSDGNAVWDTSDAVYHYPRLAALSGWSCSGLSALKLFRTDAATDTVYEVTLGGTVTAVLPATGASGVLSASAPFTEGAAVPEEGYLKTAYTASAPKDDEMKGTLTLHFEAAGLSGGLSISYTLGVRIFQHGHGKQDDPYIIPDADTLDLFRRYTDLKLGTDKTYYIISGADKDADGNYLYPSVSIDLSGYPDWPCMTQVFSGHLTGNITTFIPGKSPADRQTSSIVGLNTTGHQDAETGRWTAGLFYSLGAKSSVESLVLEDFTITSPAALTNTDSAAGVLSALADGGSVEDVQTSGTVAAARNARVGGLIGWGNLGSGSSLSISRVSADVTISAVNGADGKDSNGAGGLLGVLNADTSSSSSPTTVNISQSAAYGSMTDWGAMGGLIGYLDNTKVALNVTDCLSLGIFNDEGVSSLSSCAGLIGAIYNLQSGQTVVDRSYYAGENYVNSSADAAHTRVVGGLVGRVQATAKTDGIPNDFTKLTIKNSLHNTDANSVETAILYTYVQDQDDASVWAWKDHPAWAWPDSASGLPGSDSGGTSPDPDNNYGTAYVGNGKAFGMSQGADSIHNQMTGICGWPADGGVWTFDDGLFPRLTWETKLPEEQRNLLTAKHLAVHYTAAMTTNTATNVYVRYAGAALSASADNLRVTANGLMAVATATGDAQEEVHISIGGQDVRTVYITPSVEARGFRDVSIYYVNPDGMWRDEDGSLTRTWTVYNADALAGLSVIFNGEAIDVNGLPVPDEADRPGAKPGDLIELGRDIDLGAAYYGMDAYYTWYPIGTGAKPFDAVFDGRGHTLSRLIINPYIAYTPGSGQPYADSYYQDREGELGLFGTIQNGTVRDLVVTAGGYESDGKAYRDGGVGISSKTSRAGVLAGALGSGAVLENCLVSVPIHSLSAHPDPDGKVWNWDAVSDYGAAPGTPVGGLAGVVTGDASILNCAFTGYVYTIEKRPADGSAPTETASGTVGGLVGSVERGTLTVKDSYAAGYVGGSIAGGLVGSVAAAGSLTASGCAYDQNAAGGSAPAVGSGAVDAVAAASVPDSMGTGWDPPEAPGLYPGQTALSGGASTSALRIRMAVEPQASSAISGEMVYAGAGAALAYSTTQPRLDSAQGQVDISGNAFTKRTDGPAELQLRLDGGARWVLVNLRCWYDDSTTDENGVKHYTISTAGELWELSEIVNGAIGKDGSRVGHSHANLPAGQDYDDFAGAVVELGADIDLTQLFTLLRAADPDARPSPVEQVADLWAWTPIGAARPFAGVFDGKGHAVSGMTNRVEQHPNGDPDEETVTVLSGATAPGLFGTVDGAVRDLLVTNFTLTVGDGGTGGPVAAAVGASGSITGCGASGVVQVGSAAAAGGLVGANQGAVEDCFSTAELTQDAHTGGALLGGLAARNGGSIQRGYFTGYCATAGDGSAAAGVAAQNTGTVSGCYTAAYLAAKSVYSAAPGTVQGCYYDGRFTTSADGSARRADGSALAMGDTGWKAGSGGFYPRLAYFDALPGCTLADAADMAAALFEFSGYTGAGYARFSTVSAAAAKDGLFLQSGNPAMLAVSGSSATATVDSSGEVLLYLCLGGADAVQARNPVYLVIPSALAISYRFDWSPFLTDEYKIAGFHAAAGADTWQSSGGAMISTASDLRAFLDSVSAGTAYEGLTVTLAADIDLGGGALAGAAGTFSGLFQGGGHSISNAALSGPLFQHVGAKGQVTALALRGVNAAVSGGGDLRAALVAGVNDGRISYLAAEGCSVDCTQQAPGAPTLVGGLVAENNGTLDCSYFYTNTTNQIRTAVSDASGLEMGGLVGRNTGLVRGCYTASTLYQGGTFQNFSAMVGLNDGGQIAYSYWRSDDAGKTEADVDADFTAYRTADGGAVPARDLFCGQKDGAWVARWLSADSYGGAYYYDAGENLFRLDRFRMAEYDLTGVFGAGASQYMMLGLQYVAADSGDALFSNAVCSWKGYLFPNYADLPLTAGLSVQMPVLSETLACAVTGAYVIRGEVRDEGGNVTQAATAPMSSLAGSTATVTGAGGVYGVSALGTKPVRLLVDLALAPDPAGAVRPWGVYREDTTSYLGPEL